MNQRYNKDTHQIQQLTINIAQLVQELRAADPVIIDLRSYDHICDFFIICTARSKLHQLGLSDAINKFLLDQDVVHVGEPKKRMKNADAWLVLDYATFVVHIMSEQARGFYELERLWFDAPRIALQEPISSA